MTTSNKIVLIFTGIFIFLCSIYIGHHLWYTDDVKDGAGIPAGLVIFIGVGLGLTLTFWDKVNTTKKGILFPVLGTIATFIIVDQYQRHLKENKIQNEGQKTFGIVTFRGYVQRGKSGGQEIRYYFSVAGKKYEKYATNEQYINTMNIKAYDTIVIKYWISNPNYHDYEVKKNGVQQ